MSLKFGIISLIISTAFAASENVRIKLVNPVIRFPGDENFVPLPENFVQSISTLNSSIRAGGGEIDAIINEYADIVFKNVENFIMEGYDPTDMPDLKTGFSYWLIFHYYGTMSLTRGMMSDISTVKRAGDVEVSYRHGEQILDLIFPIGFDDLTFTYQYTVQLMGIGPIGGIDGIVKDVKAQAQLEFDFKTYNATLKKFQLNDMTVKFLFTGHPILDWLINILTNVAATLLNPAIKLFLQTLIGGALTNVVDTINDFLGPLLS